MPRFQDGALTAEGKLLDLMSRLSDKVGALGSIVAAMGCASCFPAIASLGAALGLGFLSRFEGFFLNTLLPILAIIALATNLWMARSHRRVGRLLLGVAGPAMVLATLYLFWTDDWSTYLFYVALAFMFTASVWDIVSPPRKVCATGIHVHE